MTVHRLLFVVLMLASCTVIETTAAAQEPAADEPAAAPDEPAAAPATRQEQIADQQAEKASDLHPYVPGRVEKVLEDFRRRTIEEPSGFYPILGSVYSGGGFTPGVGYRRLFGENSLWYTRGLYSFKNYKLVEAGVVSRSHLDGRLELTANTGWRDATQVGFYGLGMDTSKDDRANVRLTQTTVAGSALFKPVPIVVLQGRVSFDDINQLSGQGSFPSVDQVYTPATAPGLGSDVTYIYSSALAGIDTRPAAGYTRTGGYYGVSFHDFADVDNVFGFDRVDVDLVQHVPVARETWVLSLRGRVQTVLNDDDVVPYFMLPSLGSGSTLRAYQSWRFRDRHSLLTSAEWRWVPNRLAFDMAVFFDAGKVTARRADLNFSNLTTDWGIGARFHGPKMTFLRIELTHGSEGWHSVWSGSAAF